MHFDSVYRLVEGVQVRHEVFGLLFYDVRGPRLYFVPSKNMITDEFFGSNQRLGDLMDRICAEMPWPREWVRNQLGQILEKLERKGLICGQPIC